MKRLVYMTALCSALCSWDAWAMSLEEVLRSSSRHYPSIQKSRAGLEAQEGKVQAARGAFDWELNQKAISRISGYYEGDYVESQITRRLSDSATRIYGGYRVSQDGFPVYEDQNVTLSGGEFNAGVALSLWRNRIIDEERFSVTDAELERKQKNYDLLLTQFSVQYDAMQAYLDWVAAGRTLTIAENLLLLAKKRQDGFKTRASKGDIADIFVTENQQYIAKRSADVNDATRMLDNYALKLSLFWRDNEGNPIKPSRKDLPKDFPSLSTPSIDIDRQIERARELRPELIKIDLGLKRERNKLLLSENKRMPKVDFIAQGGRDIGTGLNASDRARRGGNEGKIGLNISIPLQTNTGEGLMRQSQATIRQLEQEQRLLNDQIASEIQMAANNYHVAGKNVTLAKQEASIAETMEKSERERFNSGAADFFVLNMREERAAEARRKVVESRLKLLRSIGDYYLATLQYFPDTL